MLINFVQIKPVPKHCYALHALYFLGFMYSQNADRSMVYTLKLTFNLTEIFLKMLSQNQHKYIDNL